MHNKEMHAKNGNIGRPSDISGGRAELIAHLRTMMWDAPPIVSHIQSTDTSILEDCDSNTTKVFYSDTRYPGNTYLDNAGAIHQ